MFLESENIVLYCDMFYRLEDGEDACTEARYELKEKNKVNYSTSVLL